MDMHKNHANIRMNENHYRHLLIMAVLSFIAMYILTYVMVNIIGTYITTSTNSIWQA